MARLSKILVTGDFIVDHHILTGNRFENKTLYKKNISIVKKTGGAYLTYELILQSTSKENIDVSFDLDINKLIAAEPEYPAYQSYLNWNIDEFEKEGKKMKSIVFKEYLGFGEKIPDTAGFEYQRNKNAEDRNDIIIIDEANLGFRDKENLWTTGQNSTVIYKTSYPICTGKLFQTLVSNCGKNFFTVVTLENLRRYNIKVSRNISWEQTALDLVFEVTHNKQLKPLLQSPNLIITIGTAGAIHSIHGDDPEKAEFYLLFDPANMEEEWEEKEKIANKAKFNGSQVGLGSSFLAGFVTGYYLSSRKYEAEHPGENNFYPTWSDYIVTGLNFIRNTLTHGLISGINEESSIDYNVLTTTDIENSLAHRFVKAFIPSPYWDKEASYLKSNYWSILRNNYDAAKQGSRQKGVEQFYSLARSLAQNGIRAIKYAPLIKFGKLVTFDRKEIEGFRNIRKQIIQYYKYDKGSRPLNIAVFGCPGSGKSFAVKELAKSIFEFNNELLSFQVYNLSQFKDAAELAGAFHTIRDAVLDGKLPFIFWDEFDSDNLGWLQFMLAPMQDGKFQDGKDTHPLGKAIFVFAGGTCNNMEQFKSQENEPDFKNKKGPDFLSRINCYIDIFGPNQRKFYNPDTKQCDKDDESDISFSIRRALFLRVNLGIKEDRVLNMDCGLMSAFLEVSQFNNGSRSLERLLNPLKNNKSGAIVRSDLPSFDIMAMNVDFSSFIDLMYKSERDEECLYEKIAEHIHKVWAKKNVKESIYNVAFEELPIDARLDNIAAAKRIKEIINGTKEFILTHNVNIPVGCSSFENRLKSDPDFLDKLAEMEHNGWRTMRETVGWTTGSRSDYHKIHPCLVPYMELDKDEKDPNKQYQKNKDRDTIRTYTEFLKESDYYITEKT